MTFLPTNSPTVSRGAVTEMNSVNGPTPMLLTPSTTQLQSNSINNQSVNDQIDIGALSIDQTMTDATQLTSPQNVSLTTRGRAPVRDPGVESIPTPVRCINPASGTLSSVASFVCSVFQDAYFYFVCSELDVYCIH